MPVGKQEALAPNARQREKFSKPPGGMDGWEAAGIALQPHSNSKLKPWKKLEIRLGLGMFLLDLKNVVLVDRLTG